MTTRKPGNTRRVKGYPFDKVRKRQELRLKTYEYDMPFNYENITVYRKDYAGGEFHGVELINHNDAFHVEKLEHATPGEWVCMRLKVTVPPLAAESVLCFDVAHLAQGETIAVADAFAGVVPDDWSSRGPIPENTKNLLSNPGFKGKGATPSAWEIIERKPGHLQRVTKRDAGRAGLLLGGTDFSVRSAFDGVNPGQTLAFEVWAKANHPCPKTVWLMTRFRSKDGHTFSTRLPDVIIIEEEQPIVRVAVIGSACTPPGYVMLEAEPYEDFYSRGDFIRCAAPLRFRQDNLWGMHLRWDALSDPRGIDHGYEPVPEGMIRRYPGVADCSVKLHSATIPLAGMSCAVFEIPRSHRVTITGGSDNNAWMSDGAGPDNHYSFRTIRTVVASGSGSR